MRVFWQQIIDFFDRADAGGKRIAVVIGIKGVQQRAVFCDQSRFCSGRTGIDAKITVSLIVFQTAGRNFVAAVAG